MIIISPELGKQVLAHLTDQLSLHRKYHAFRSSKRIHKVVEMGVVRLIISSSCDDDKPFRPYNVRPSLNFGGESMQPTFCSTILLCHQSTSPTPRYWINQYVVGGSRQAGEQFVGMFSERASSPLEPYVPALSICTSIHSLLELLGWKIAREKLSGIFLVQYLTSTPDVHVLAVSSGKWTPYLYRVVNIPIATHFVLRFTMTKWLLKLCQYLLTFWPLPI